MLICTKEELGKMKRFRQGGKQMSVVELIVALEGLYAKYGDIRVSVLDEEAWINYPKIKARGVEGDDLEDGESPYIAVAFSR